MTGFWVRPATAGDIRAVRDLARRVGREFRVSPRLHEQAAAAAGASLLWVVEEGRGKIVGSCAVRDAEEGSWELHSLYLAPEYRGIGLGKSLVEHALRVARQHGALRVVCYTQPEFLEAHSLLERLGFRELAGPSLEAGPTLELVFTQAT